MNNVRRKKIDEAISLTEKLQDSIQELREMIEEIKDEEQEYLDNMPENLQSSERYIAAEAAVENLEGAMDTLDELDIDEITSMLDEAKGN